MHHLKNSKYWPFTMYQPLVSRMSVVSRKNATVINFALSRVSIGFSCTVSKIQNTSNSRRISPWEVIQARFREKMQIFEFSRPCTKNRSKLDSARDFEQSL
ncbi:hypothetical protein B296_00045474 [Ensete ventricosum]|uniref:Uncharacterized protein n=1 Tax=Ensete ventricosum TaxID=4639 RepID=A0A426X0W1_ENSVE|nr:hypothetical protein B296_00045474 [Ensete ventricosum]